MMADPAMVTLTTAREIASLADRLYSCGISKLSTESPEVARDLRIASRVIRVLAADIRTVRVESD
jgi:hypothetical protein